MTEHEFRQRIAPILSVLIIDDQQSSAVLLQNLLFKLNFSRITLVKNCQQTIHACQQQAYDLVFIDFHLDHGRQGSELLSILRQESWISAHCAVIMISGDPSQEVLLTCLENEPDAFLSKPFQPKILLKKLQQSWSASQWRKPIYQALDQGQIEIAIQLCQRQWQLTPKDYRVENLLLDLLQAKQDWGALAQCIEYLESRHPSFKVQLFKSQLAHHNGDTEQAITLLKRLIQQAPLYSVAYDRLVGYLQSEKRYDQALHIAEQVASLTPSIATRTLTVAQLAVLAKQKYTLLNAGKQLVLYMPLLSQTWLLRFLQYLAIYEQFDPLYRDDEGQDKLTQLYPLMMEKLPITQKTTIQLLEATFQARHLLHRKSHKEARALLLKALSRYYNQISKLPSLLLFEVLPLLIQLGEHSLTEWLHQEIRLRAPFTDQALPNFERLQKQTHLFAHAKAFANHLQTIDSLTDWHEKQPHLQVLQKTYPYSTEVQLAQLAIAIDTQQESDIHRLLMNLKTAPLPKKWVQHHQSLLERAQQQIQSQNKTIPQRWGFLWDPA